MKLYLKGLIILFLFINNVSFAASNPSTVPIYTDSTQTIVVNAANPTFIIQLKANPTTGYSWSTKSYDNHLLTLINYQYIAPATNLIGAGGESVWTFQVNPQALQKPMTTSIHLLYARPWDLADHPTDIVFIVTNTK